MAGDESRQIDVVVTSTSPFDDLHNKDRAGKTFACVDGTVAVALLKSFLDATELSDALENLASSPEKQPIYGRMNPLLSLQPEEYDDWPFKIIYAPKGISAEALTQRLVGLLQGALTDSP